VPVAQDGVRYAYYSHDYANDRITDPAGVNPALTASTTASGNLNVLAPVGVIAQNGSDVQAAFLHTVGTIGASQAKGTSGDVIAFPANLSATQHASTENLSPALGALNPTAVAFQPGNLKRGCGSAPNTEVFPTLAASHGRGQSDQDPHIAVAMQVRRLTPRECERLQGFPDDYTLIPWKAHQAWAKRKGTSASGVSFEEFLIRLTGRGLRQPTTQDCPDGPRYKALGNSMCVFNMRWIGVRLAAHLEQLA